MAVEAHLLELKSKHQTLDARIQSELKAPAPDTLHVATLKKRKLHLKEKMAALES